MDWLSNIGSMELVVIILIGLFIFGPDRLPKAIGDGARMLRQLRQMARNATTDLSNELGTTIELEDLRPKTFLRKHLLSEEDEKALREPLESIYSDLRSDLRQMSDSVSDVAKSVNGATAAVSAEARSGVKLRPIADRSPRSQPTPPPRTPPPRTARLRTAPPRTATRRPRPNRQAGATSTSPDRGPTARSAAPSRWENPIDAVGARR